MLTIPTWPRLNAIFTRFTELPHDGSAGRPVDDHLRAAPLPDSLDPEVRAWVRTIATARLQASPGARRDDRLRRSPQASRHVPAERAAPDQAARRWLDQVREAVGSEERFQDAVADAHAVYARELRALADVAPGSARTLVTDQPTATFGRITRDFATALDRAADSRSRDHAEWAGAVGTIDRQITGPSRTPEVESSLTRLRAGLTNGRADITITTIEADQTRRRGQKPAPDSLDAWARLHERLAVPAGRTSLGTGPSPLVPRVDGARFLQSGAGSAGTPAPDHRPPAARGRSARARNDSTPSVHRA